VDVVDAPELELDVGVERLILITFASRAVCHRVDLHQDNDNIASRQAAAVMTASGRMAAATCRVTLSQRV